MDNKKQIEAITKKLDLIRRVLNGDPSNHYRHYDWVDIDKANSEYDSYYIKLRDLKVANMSPQEQLAEAVKRYADANYSTGGWDYVSECYDTKEIVAMVEYYLPLLVTAGLNDPRVTYWEPSKWVAKLRATKTDNNTLLLKTNMGAGHGGKSGRFQSIYETAEEVAFILWQMGEAQ